MFKCCKMMIESPAMQEDLGSAARETAIKYFHIDDYLARWDEAFREALK